MIRLTVVFLLFPTLALRAADGLAITINALDGIAAPNAVGTSVTRGPDGVVWLTWLERQGPRASLKVATLNPADSRWSNPRVVASGTDWIVNAADFPALTAGENGRATVVWPVLAPPPAGTSHGSGDPHHRGSLALTSQTIDGGRTWSPRVPLSRESQAVEFVSLATLADGRVLATWLDGRASSHGVERQQLYARILGESGPDTRIDGSVCECCQTTLTAFLDGGALVAYRGKTNDNVRDIRTARFRNGAWEESRVVHADGWRIDGCPVNGPQLASDGGRVAAAWFSAADNSPRVLASLSPDAGARFLVPLRLSDGPALGRVSTQLLHDGAFLVSWVDGAGRLWLRRISPDFSPGEPLQVSSPTDGRVTGYPRLALRDDYAGGTAPARLVVAYTCDGTPALRTYQLTVPEGDLVEVEKNCDCAPSADQLQGYAMRGTVEAVDASAGTVRVRHFEVPGVFPAGTRDFKLAPTAAVSESHAGRAFFGRAERRDGKWWLLEMRLIATPPNPGTP